MYNVIPVANHFIFSGIKEDVNVTHMKLQKLVYFAHGIYFARSDEPLINESIEAWQYGPVVPSLYRKLRDCGNARIVNPIIFDPEDLMFGSEKMVLDTKTELFLSGVWNALKKYTAIQLSTASHLPGSPWHDTIYKENGGRIIKGKDISPDLIKSYFKGKVLKNG